MAKVLRLYNTYSRCIRDARLARGELIAAPGISEPNLIHGSLYICGPTVYAESHLGHALTYVRADLFRRVLRSLFNVKLTSVMNITDVDDKILAKAKEESSNTAVHDTAPERHPFNRISESYYKSFVEDMNHIRVLPPDLTVKVSKQIDTITSYIRHLERRGHAYLASNGDVYFKVSSIPNYQGRVDSRKQGASNERYVAKVDDRDFALWKAAKPGEPVWVFESEVSGRKVPGRPGWHVQCSAISSAIFGNRLDFHFGGKDLIFPHNYNEQACCCAYHSLDTSKDTNVWSANWLHSGHLILKEEKMSKSLGNVVGIRNFINDSSVNALRLLCVDSHYRSDVVFDNDLLVKMRSLDHKVSAFASYLSDELHRMCDAPLRVDGKDDTIDEPNAICLNTRIAQVHEDIMDGACDDLDLSKGLHSILDLAKSVYNAGPGNVGPRDLVMARSLLADWCAMCGLRYGSTSDLHDENLARLVSDFRQDIRGLVIADLRRRKQEGYNHKDELLDSLLNRCDNVRRQLDELGFVIRDKGVHS